MKQYRALKIRTDSMEQALTHQGQYYTNIQRVLEGKVPKLDTNKLPLPKLENTDD
jgi:hypothetical protein